MGINFFFILLTFFIAVAAAMLHWLPAEYLWWTYVDLGLAAISLIFLYRRIVVPSSAATRGLELISAQDFNNTLAKVGERNADKVVALFNSLIEKLRSERLSNLERESFLSLLMEASPMGVIIFDFDGKISMANKAFLSFCGIAKEEDILGKAIEDIPSVLASRMASVPLGESHTIRKGDARMWRCSHLSFIQSGFKRHFYLIENLTEEVMEAERRAFGKVIRTMSHEVNNTLGGVTSVLDLMHDYASEPDVREVIESCTDRCDKLCQFIGSFADVVRLPEASLQRADIVAEAKRLMPFLKELAGANIEMDLVSEASDIYANIDMALMQQALVNIVKNAAESISGRGFIRLHLSQDGNIPTIEIANNGKPIGEEDARQLFTPFFSTKKGGRGLGLTLTADILRKHQASFRLFTASDGITRFIIKFAKDQNHVFDGMQTLG